MYFLDFLSQYKRFLDGTLSAPDFSHWLFSHNDEMEAGLHDREWASFVEAQHLAAEFTGGHIGEAEFRHQLDQLWTTKILPLNASGIANPSS